jgi:hypothetical protein
MKLILEGDKDMSRAIAHRVCSIIKDNEKRTKCYATMVRVLSGDVKSINELKLILTKEELESVKSKMREILKEIGEE